MGLIVLKWYNFIMLKIQNNYKRIIRITLGGILIILGIYNYIYYSGSTFWFFPEILFPIALGFFMIVFKTKVNPANNLDIKYNQKRKSFIIKTIFIVALSISSLVFVGILTPMHDNFLCYSNQGPILIFTPAALVFLSLIIGMYKYFIKFNNKFIKFLLSLVLAALISSPLAVACFGVSFGKCFVF